MPEEGPQHVTISTMPSVPPITGAVKLGPAPKRRNPWAVVLAIVLSLAAVGAGVFAVLSLRGEPGGASSPEEAVERLFLAIDDQDVLGALDVLLPGERTTFRGSVLSLVEELTRLGVLSDATDLNAVGGLDVSFTGLQFSAEAVTDDLANVEVRGTASMTGDVRALPLGDLVTRWLDDLEPEDTSIDVRGESLEGVRLTTVQHGGRWYVSLLFSIAEAARLDAGLAPVPADAAVRAYGSPTPEAALDQVLLAIETLDLERLIAVLDPNEAAALQRYAPLFLDEAQADLDALDLRWAVEDVTYEVTRDGDRAVVHLLTISVEGELDTEPFSFRLADGCTRAEFEGERVEWCEGSPALDGTGMDVDEELQQLLDDASAMFADLGPTGLVMNRVSGSWYTSPISTITDNLLALLRAVDRQELEQLIEDVEATFEEIIEWEEPVFEPSFYDCLMDVSDAEAVLTCLDEGIAAGLFAATDVPVELRFPQCRLVEPYLYGFWDLTDEEFTEIVGHAHGCFAILAFTGEVDPLEIPYEARGPECFAGVNPFNQEDLRETDRLLAEVNACLLER